MKIYQYISFAACLVLGCKAIKPEPSQRLSFTAADSYPEGVAYDSLNNQYFVSSARLGQIGRVSSDGTYSVFFNENGIKSSYGMKVHPDNKRLYVCIGDANYSKYTSADTRAKMARLLILDKSTGKKLDDIDLSKLIASKHFINDLTFDDKGNAYVTDSFAHAIYKVSTDGESSVFSRSEQFVTEGIGINGIVFHPNGYLLVDNSATGSIYKVPVGHPSHVSRVKTDQFFMGADGLLLTKDSKLTVVVNGGNDKIFQLKSDDNWNSAYLSGTTLAADRFTYPATATFNKDEIWVMNSRFNELLDSNSVPAIRFAIQKAVIKPIPKTQK